MIIQGISKGIKRQDWITVFVEVVIVIVGVYVGIFIGNSAKERAMRIEVNKALITLNEQLKEDLVNLNNIVAIRIEYRDISQRAIDVLFELPVNEEDFAVSNEEMLLHGRTFFPNGSAYQTIRDLGYLTEVKDVHLQLLIANLFERMYVRQNVLATNLDSILSEYQANNRDRYWDRLGRKFIAGSPDTIAILRNGIIRISGNGNYYRGFLERGVKIEIEKTIVALDDYLKQ